jgi:hypothetical protein
VRGVESPVNDLVADRCPAGFAAEMHAQTVLFEELKLLSHHERRAIAERHEAHAQRL